uniref:C2H2-type domain-containing protein n=1 Tax=Caenorhabditis tropicalis TaxID=1561998 RepID=A0A1I7UAK1_9PELO
MNEPLGNEHLLFGHDPFIGGAMSAQENLNAFNDLLGDSFSFDPEALYGNNNQQDTQDELDRPPTEFIQQDLHGEPGMFGYDPYPEFVFDNEDTESNQYEMLTNVNLFDDVVETPANVELYKDMGQVAQKLTPQEVPVTEYNELTVDTPAPTSDFSTPTDNGSPIEVYQDMATLQTAPAQDALVNKMVNKKMTTSTLSNNRHAPYEQRNDSIRQRVLFPVKVTKVLSRTNYHQYAATTRAAYADQYYSSGDAYANVPEPTVADVVKLPVRRKAMSDIVPRDTASNHIRCNMCNASFSTKLALEFHEVEKHCCVYAFKCLICDEAFATLSFASVHIVKRHNKPIIPLYNKSIVGHGININDKKSSQRRISGMICSFLSKHLAELGLLTGLSQSDHDIVKLHAKKLYRPSPPPFKTHFNDHVSDPDPQLQETATLNQLLKEEYIYGKSICRVPVESIDQDTISYGHGQELEEMEAQTLLRTMFPHHVSGPGKPAPIRQPQKALAVKKTYAHSSFTKRAPYNSANRTTYGDIARANLAASNAQLAYAGLQQSSNAIHIPPDHDVYSTHLYQ